MKRRFLLPIRDADPILGSGRGAIEGNKALGFRKEAILHCYVRG